MRSYILGESNNYIYMRLQMTLRSRLTDFHLKAISEKKTQNTAKLVGKQCDSSGMNQNDNIATIRLKQ